MKKGPIIISILVLAAGLTYVALNSGPPEDIDNAMVDPAETNQTEVVDNGTPAPVPEGDPVDFEVSVDDSSVEFTGYKVGGSQNCTFFEFEGAMTIIGDALETTTVDMTIDLESIIHDNSTFVNVMTGPAFFDVENHPSAMFKSTSVKKDGDGFRVNGNLTLRGISKPIAFPAEISLSEEGLSLNAEFKVNRQAWEITYKGKKDALIKDEVVIAVALVAEKSDG